VTLLLVGSAAPVLAHPGGHSSLASTGELRNWIVRDTGRVVRGSLLVEKAGVVYVEVADGRTVQLTLRALSPADQSYVSHWWQKVRAVNGIIPPAAVAPPSPTGRATHLRAGALVLGAGCLILVLLVSPRVSRVRAVGGFALAGGALVIAITGLWVTGATADSPPSIAASFEPFKKEVKTRWDATHLYVESDGLPEHLMMRGIRSWQQQVPLPQPYTGDNAWRIPLRPVLAEKPISARTSLFRGAIALAVNGVPIFNALNNRGVDSNLEGELDEWGGHCGRADDYHYHTAPLHLQTQAGAGKPIAYGLDGFPLYGLTEPDGSPVRKLDDLNGHDDPAGGYHYHGTRTYPYINGGMRGVVQVRGDQVDPQPRAAPVRPAGQPLRGAAITGFTSAGDKTYSLEFTWSNAKYTLDYRVEKDGRYVFDHIGPTGDKQTYTFRRQGAR